MCGACEAVHEVNCHPAAKQKRRAGRIARIPVVIMTGHPDPAVEGNATLTKPFTSEDLLGTMARFVPSLRRPIARSSA